jgi:REP element-mobilizing transposase RayT
MMTAEFPPDRRKSYMEMAEIYFWTTTINQWQKLLLDDAFKDIIIQSLDFLSDAGKIDVFGFVIMPNHLHLIWRALEMNGKETPQGSFLKYTAHEFRKKLYEEDPRQLDNFKVNAHNKYYEFWQRDPLAIHLYTKDVAFQKLHYSHYNPLAEHWNLAMDPSDYTYSSAKFYEQGIKSFAFLKDLREEF